MSNTKPKLTDKQIQAYRLVSGEFEGLSAVDAAKKMSITVQALNRLLSRAEKLCPQLFPLLTKQEADVKVLIKANRTNDEIADELQVGLSRVSQIIKAIDEKQGTTCSKPVKMLSYESWMDSQIVRRF